MKQSEVFTLPDKRYRVQKGLYLEVRNEGRNRGWLFIYRRNNRRTVLSLGTAANVTLKQAQAKAVQYSAILAQGKDPKLVVEEAKRLLKEAEEKAKEDAQEARLFKNVAFAALKNRAEVRQWKNPEASVTSHLNSLKKYAFKTLGNKPVADITHLDVLAVLTPLWKTHTALACGLRQIISVTLAYAIRQDLRPGPNPAAWRENLELDLPNPKKIRIVKHHAALPLKELRRLAPFFFWDASAPALATLFGVLTATRASEFTQADWSEIDLEKRIWAIPPSRRKDQNSSPFLIPISDSALLVLQKTPTRTGPVFPNGKGQSINASEPRHFLRKTTKLPSTMHGCRSTFRDWAAMTHVDPIVAEKCLMHSTGNEVERTYQRSDLFELRREVMQNWGQTVLPKSAIRKPPREIAQRMRKHTQAVIAKIQEKLMKMTVGYEQPYGYVIHATQRYGHPLEFF